ncbi:MAG: hypothetical protein HOO86_08660 [Bacteroidales bacterium]|nr:hypothetical protein [Bacteroidales bacterium]
MKYFLIIFALLGTPTVFALNPCDKCDIERVLLVSENLDCLTTEMLNEFLCTFDKSCSVNVEYSEFSNETLYAVLEKAPTLFFQVIANGQFDNDILIEEIKNPINDLIDLQSVYDNAKSLFFEKELKTKYLNALIIAAEKNGENLEE